MLHSFAPPVVWRGWKKVAHALGWSCSCVPRKHTVAVWCGHCWGRACRCTSPPTPIEAICDFVLLHPQTNVTVPSSPVIRWSIGLEPRQRCRKRQCGGGRSSSGGPTGCPTDAACCQTKCSVCVWTVDCGCQIMGVGGAPLVVNFVLVWGLSGRAWAARVAMGLELAARPLRRPTGSFMTALCGGECGDARDFRLFSPLLAEQSYVPWVAVKAPCFAVGPRASGGLGQKAASAPRRSRPDCS